MSTVIEKWDEILGIVKKEHDLSDVRFDTWLKPLKVYDVSGNVVTIVASDQVRLSYINKNYKLPLQVTISEVTGMTDCEVKFILPEDVPAKKSISDAAPDQDNRFKARCEEANLNPKYTFNTFIVGSNNKLAQAAAPGSSGISGKYVQSAVYLWWCRTWQDPSYAFHRPLYY